MKKMFLILLLGAFSSRLLAGIEGEVAAYSNFIWRGTTFSENKPAIQTTLDAQEENGFFIGGFVSNAEFSDPAMGANSQVTQEVDVSLGKRWVTDLWEVQIAYNRFIFPGASVFDTDEINLFINYDRYILELSYLDDYFGYQSTYRYLRLGHEWSYTKSFGATLFAGYNSYGTPKGGIWTSCNDECSQTTSGAGNPDYIDLFLTHRKILPSGLILELDINWTNRKEYSVENDIISKDDAKDFAALVGVIIPFNL